MEHSYLDEYSGVKSLLSKLDPRVKIIVFFAFIITVVFTGPTAYTAFLLYGCLLAALIGISKIPWRFVFMRSLAVIPFVAMIAVFIPFLKEGKVAGGYSFGSLRLTVTYDGLTILWNVMIKAYLSIVCIILLTASTRFSHLLKAFEKMRMPSVIVMILSFMYRYIFVVVDELMRIRQAKEARSVGGSCWFHTRALANMLGVLFVRSYEKGEAVYLAMCSRGFEGTIKTADWFRITAADVLFCCSIAVALIGIRMVAG